jgi:photosystem II stability/assembly factor-like uncharacterized protein
MKTLLNKKLTITLAAIVCFSSAKAQLISADKNFKKNFPAYMYQKQNFKNQNSSFKRFNPYWEQVNAPHLEGSYVNDVEVPNARTVWGGIGIYAEGIPMTIYYELTQNGGNSWKLDSLPLSTDYGVSSFAAIDGYTCYAAVVNVFFGGGGVYKTNNGGKTWRQLSPGNLFDSTSFPDFIHFFDAWHGVAVGDGNGQGDPYLEIYTTSNAGLTWQRVPKENIPAPNGFPYSFNNAYYAAGNRMWFQGFDSNGGDFIYRSDDYGHHWQAFPISNFFFDFAFTDKLNGLANSFDDNGITEIYSTNDGGETWEQVNYSGIAMGNYIAAVPGTSAYVTTSSVYTAVFGSSYSNDNGKTWTLIDSGANALHNDVKFLNPFIGWSGESEASSSDPGGMFKWRGFLHTNSTDNAIAATKNNTTSLSVYPNPVSNTANISFSLQQSRKVSLTIYDLNGRLIKTLADVQMQQGTHQLTWNAKDEKGSAVVAGIYLLNLQAGDYIETKKLSVVR